MATTPYTSDPRYKVKGNKKDGYEFHFAGNKESKHTTRTDAELAAQAHKDSQNMSFKFEAFTPAKPITASLSESISKVIQFAPK